MEYNALIRKYHGESLKVLARILVADLKDFPADWKIRYQSQEINRDTTTLEDLCCGPKNPLQIYKPVKNSFPITVRTVDGKSIEVVVSPNDTLRVLKLKIFQADQSYPPHAQELSVKQECSVILYFDGIPLERSRIGCGTTVYLNLKSKYVNVLKFGVDFKPIDLEAAYERSTGVTHALPHWSRYSAGINICGDCLNLKCPSTRFPGRSEVVVRRPSYGELRVNFSHDHESLFTCPVCSPTTSVSAQVFSSDEEGNQIKHQIVPKSLIFSEARAVVFFKFAGSSDVADKYYNSERRSTPQEFKFVKGSVDRLEVTTVEPWRSPYCCVKCDTKIAFQKEELSLACGHVYHVWCRPSSILKRMKRLQCTVCMSKVITVGSVRELNNLI